MLDAADARTLVDLAIAASAAMEVPQNIAVVDAAGQLIAFHRMDGAKPYTVDFAITKARTAAGLQAPTEKLAEIALPGQRGFGLNTLHGGDVAILGGGMPVTADGVVLGAIGISSGSVYQDADIARSTVQEFEALGGQAKSIGTAG
ncbi:MAG: heme-binding protein [Sphingomonadales bacterium]|nr:MAG: heme-binding protein [Sphingomonadales bacterium]